MMKQGLSYNEGNQLLRYFAESEFRMVHLQQSAPRPLFFEERGEGEGEGGLG